MEPPNIHNTLSIQGYLVPSICTWSPLIMTIIPTIRQLLMISWMYDY